MWSKYDKQSSSKELTPMYTYCILSYQKVVQMKSLEVQRPNIQSLELLATRKIVEKGKGASTGHCF